MNNIYTLTKVGIVNNDCNNQITFAILMLERELRSAFQMIQDAREEGLDAFLPSLTEKVDQLIAQITELNTELKRNLTRLA